jgi:glycosyltransferase involved in cell wall biosynthesis
MPRTLLPTSVAANAIRSLFESNALHSSGDSIGASMPKVELISNISHYYYTALSLYHSGLLGHYITGPCALDSEEWMSRFGGSFKRLWDERLLKGIPPEMVRRMWIPEILQKSIKKIGGTSEQSNWVFNEIFSRKAAWMMEDCDAVHFVHSVGREAAIKAKRTGAKVICDMREEHPQFQQDILSNEAKELAIEFIVPGSSYKHRVLEELDLADAVICPSAYAKRTFIEHGIPADKIVVCPYGADIHSLAPSHTRHDRRFTVLFLGSICMRKGIHYLLEGFKMAALRDARLVLAGPVEEQFRPVLQKFEGLFEEVGRVPHSQVLLWYQQADVFVIPSLADSYALVVLEAMSAGLPVIVSENTGSAEIIADGNNGFVIPIRNAAAIAEKLAFLYENRDACAAMGVAAAESVKASSWESYERKCVDFYNNLFGQTTSCASSDYPKTARRSQTR